MTPVLAPLKFGYGSFNDRIVLPMPQGKSYAGITGGEIAFTSPSGATGVWPATVVTEDGATLIEYFTASFDLDEIGSWSLQPYAGEIAGLPHIMMVY